MVRDVVQWAVSEATFALTAEKMRKTLGIELKGDPAASVEMLATRYLFNEQERGGVLRALVQEGDLTGYGLVNAVTSFAQDDVVDYDRATELEAVAGRMLDQSPSEWKQLAG